LSSLAAAPTPEDDDGDLRRFAESAREDAEDFFDGVFGKSCVTDDQCSAISYCKKGGSYAGLPGLGD